MVLVFFCEIRYPPLSVDSGHRFFNFYFSRVIEKSNTASDLCFSQLCVLSYGQFDFVTLPNTVKMQSMPPFTYEPHPAKR